jgi:hypothetical protein
MKICIQPDLYITTSEVAVGYNAYNQVFSPAIILFVIMIANGSVCQNK